MKKLSEHTLERALSYHHDNDLPIYENIFRTGTPMHFKLLEKVKEMYQEGRYETLDENEKELLETDIGLWDLYEGKKVPLDYPLIEEPELNKPQRGGNKKFFVYVKDPKTKNIKKVEFGDTEGARVKIDNPKARKSFVARHDCENKTDKTTPGYWSCRVPMYAKQLGLSGGGNFFW